MKNVFSLLLFYLLCSYTITAQKQDERIEQANLTVKADNEVIKYNFDTIKDLEENTDKIVDEIAENTTKKESSSLITIEMAITINTGVTSTSISASVTNTRTNIAALVKKLRTQLIIAITN